MTDLEKTIQALNCFTNNDDGPECPCEFSLRSSCETAVAKKAQELLEDYKELQKRHAALVDICDKLYAELRARKDSVYLPGVTMPSSCRECTTYGISDVVGIRCPWEKDIEMFYDDKRPKGCPLDQTYNKTQEDS